MTPEIPKVACTRRTIRVFLTREVSVMGYQPVGEIMASLLPVVTHIQQQAYYCKVCDK